MFRYWEGACGWYLEFCSFFLSGGRMCENISNISLLTAPSGSWKTQTYFREWDTSWQSSARLRRQTQQQFCGIPQIQVRKYLNLTSQPCLPMGWALKSSHVPRTTFAEKQKDYLTSKFRVGETTGQKLHAASEAKSMVTARDSNGNRLLQVLHFWRASKIQVSFQG